MQNKIKIIQVLYSFEVGGIETLILELSKKLDKDKYEFHIVTLTNDNLRMTRFLSKEVVVHALPITANELKTFSGLYKGFLGLCDVFKEVEPNIIHTHLASLPLLFISTAIKFSSVNSVHIRTVHTAGMFYENQDGFKNKVKLLAEKIAMRLVKTNIISVSNLVLRNNIRNFKNIASEIKLITNGIDLNKFDKEKYVDVVKETFGIDDSSLVVSYVARLSDEKNHIFLIDIWIDIIKEIPNAILVFAGNGELEESLKLKVERLGLKKNIIFLGSINNGPELLSITDVGVFVSSYEGFGLVLIENFAMKIPVVASDIESFKDIVIQNENAFLISLKNKEEYIKIIIELCRDSALRNRIAGNAYNEAQKYSIDTMIEKYANYYSELLQKK